MEAQIQLLGRFAVRVAAAEVPPTAFGGRLARRLVRRLAIARGSSVRRDVLTEVLWPHGAPADPDANLNVQVNRARRATTDTLIQTVEDGYALTTAAWCTVDAEQFLDRVRVGTGMVERDPRRALACLREALAGWGGEPLAEDTYASWSREWRATVNRARVQALEAASVAAVSVGDPIAATSFARRAVAIAPLREPAHISLMRALAAAGDRASALKTYDELRRTLASELGVDPSPATSEAHVDILRMESVRRSQQATPPPETSADDLPFVGRPAELRRVQDALGTGGVVLLCGVSGSGKSRLLSEAARRLERPSVSARAFPLTRHAPFAMLGILLRELLAEDVQRTEFLAPPTRDALLPLVPDLADHTGPACPVVDPQSRRALVTQGALHVLQRAAAGGLAVLLDDVQWADKSSLDVLAEAVHRVDALSLGLAFRQGEAADQTLEGHLTGLRSGARCVEELQLGSLPESAIRLLVADDDVVAAITEFSDSSPLAVREVVGALEKEGLLARTGHGRWRPRSRQAAARVRASAQRGHRELLSRRLAAQPSRRRQLLTLLALLGREASPHLLATAIGGRRELGDRVRDDLDTLRRADLVSFGELGWTLAHEDLGATIRERLPHGERTKAHARLARALTDADPAEQAHHLAAAGDPRAAEIYATASRDRLDRFATEEAARLADLGLAQSDGTPAAELELLTVRAETHYRLGDFSAARDGIRQALRLAKMPAARASLLARSAMLASGSDDMELAARLAEHAIVEAGADRGARARALAVACVIDSNTGHLDRARERSHESERLLLDVGDTTGIADVLDARAMGTFLGGAVRTAIQAFDHVARLYAETGNPLRTITPRSTRGHALLFAASFEEALSDTTQALHQAHDLGHTEGQAYALWHHAEVLTALGRIPAAETAALGALQIAEGIGHRGWTATAHRARGVVALATDDLDAAEAAFRKSREVSGEGLPLFASWAASGLATVSLRRGEIDAAARLVSYAVSTGPPLAGYEARLVQAELLVATGAPFARAMITDALACARTGGHELSAIRLHELLGGC